MISLSAVLIPIMVNLHLYESPEEATTVCGNLGLTAIACSIYENNKCDIHMPKPQSGYTQDYALFAHEMRHCAFGEFH